MFNRVTIVLQLHTCLQSNYSVECCYRKTSLPFPRYMLLSPLPCHPLIPTVAVTVGTGGVVKHVPPLALTINYMSIDLCYCSDVCAIYVHVALGHVSRTLKTSSYAQGIAAAAGPGRTKSSARMPTLLHRLLIAPRQQLTDTSHLFTGVKNRLFIISAQQCTFMWIRCLPSHKASLRRWE